MLRERAKRRERKQLESSLAAFVRAAWHVVEPSVDLEWGHHLDAICAHLEAVTRGDICNLCITIPPGCTKSITVSVMWPAWVWTTRPGVRWLCASNSDDLSTRDAVACRRLIDSDWYKARWGDKFKLTTDQNVKTWYENTARGFRTSTTVGSNVTGKKGDVLVVDDANDAIKVVSEVERDRVNSWWDKGFYNRVNHHRDARRVIIGQRTHEDDLIGHVLGTGEFVELRIPEEFEPENPCTTPLPWKDWRTAAGELLRSSRFGPEQIEAAKKRLGSLGYAAQHQQRPLSKEGYRFKLGWFQRRWIRRDDVVWLGDNLHFLWRDTIRFGTVDPAASEKNEADYTVISSWALSPAPHYHLLWLGCRRVQREIPDIVPLILFEYRKWGLAYVAIEAVGANRAVLQLAQRQPAMKVKPLDPQSQDKLVRATPAMPLAESGKIWLPGQDAEFPLSDVLEELTRFTGIKGQDKHDDVVDTLAYAVHLRDGKVINPTFKPYVLGD